MHLWVDFLTVAFGLPRFSINIGMSCAICFSNSSEFWISGIISKRIWFALRMISMMKSDIELLLISSCVSCSYWRFVVCKHVVIPANNSSNEPVNTAEALFLSSTSTLYISWRPAIFDSNGLLWDGATRFLNWPPPCTGWFPWSKSAITCCTST